jgi:hypothetical protein
VSAQLLEHDPAEVRASLAAAGAPLAGVRASATFSLEDAIVAGLTLSRSDATVLRVLPLVLARAANRLDWTHLEQAARDRGLLPVLGLVAELAGHYSGLHDLERRAASWWTPPDGARLYFAPRSRFDEELARHATPAIAKRWGFLLNVGEDSFRSLFERFDGQV